MFGWLRRSEESRYLDPAGGDYTVHLRVVHDLAEFRNLLRLHSVRPDAAAFTVWLKKPPQGHRVARIYMAAPFTGELLLHEMRHVFEGRFHR